MLIPFAKYEGIGNDFIILEGVFPDEAQARLLCDRHRGVGGDGVLCTGLRDGRPFMQVINADGSRPEMCGNGLRCVARYLADRGLVALPQMTVDTGAGPHRCEVLAHGQVRVEMPPPRLDPSEVPVRSAVPVLDAEWEAGGQTVSLTALSLGNPHAVTFDAVEGRRLELGPELERDPRFPNGANVSFAEVEDRRTLRVSVWERGVGWTRACGTGACAAVVAAVETDRVDRGQAIQVALPGGTLSVEFAGGEAPVFMTGPARHVFDGEIDLSRR